MSDLAPCAFPRPAKAAKVIAAIIGMVLFPPLAFVGFVGFALRFLGICLIQPAALVAKAVDDFFGIRREGDSE